VQMGDHVQRREITLGGGQGGGILGPRSFGLGDKTEVAVRVIWPGGNAGAWETLTADAAYQLRPAAPASKISP